MNYRSYTGPGFTESNGEIIKVPITSKVMIDPQGFRQAKPDYLSTVRPASTTEREEKSPGSDDTSNTDPGECSQALQGSTKSQTAQAARSHLSLPV